MQVLLADSKLQKTLHSTLQIWNALSVSWKVNGVKASWETPLNPAGFTCFSM